jgi:flagellar hook-basal body complex protein FliE
MSGFELPPLQGENLLRARRWPMLGQEPADDSLQGLRVPSRRPGVQDPEGIDGRGDRASGTGGADFLGSLADAIEGVDAMRKDVNAKKEDLVLGGPTEIHDVMLAMGKSEIAFNMMLEVRNKFLEAWEKLSRSVV